VATFTAQILVGRSHPNSGGINPTHYLFFSENDRPAWTLVPENVFTPSSKQPEGKVIWIPTMDNPLEDALLMIALYAVRDGKVRHLMERHVSDLGDRVEVHEAFDQPVLEELYDKCRAVQAGHKVVLTLLNVSTIYQHLPILEEHKMEVEVCVTIYSRLYLPWEGRWRTQGSLL
jgi:hypothetical protein